MRIHELRPTASRSVALSQWTFCGHVRRPMTLKRGLDLDRLELRTSKKKKQAFLEYSMSYRKGHKNQRDISQMGEYGVHLRVDSLSLVSSVRAFKTGHTWSKDGDENPSMTSDKLEVCTAVVILTAVFLASWRKTSSFSWKCAFLGQISSLSITNSGQVNQIDCSISCTTEPLKRISAGFCFVRTCSHVACPDHSCSKRMLTTKIDEIESRKVASESDQ